jgi:hypothetical protein
MTARATSFAAGLALATVAFVAAVGAEWGDVTGSAVSCTPTPRMSLKQSSSIKRQMLWEQCKVGGASETGGCRMSDYELDHIIPLCLGGSNSSSNLQLQPWPEARMKDIDEARVCRMVHAGEMSCAEGREAMRTWDRR